MDKILYPWVIQNEQKIYFTKTEQFLKFIAEHKGVSCGADEMTETEMVQIAINATADQK